MKIRPDHVVAFNFGNWKQGINRKLNYNFV